MYISRAAVDNTGYNSTLIESSHHYSDDELELWEEEARRNRYIYSSRLQD